MDDLNSPVRSIAVGARRDRDYRAADIGTVLAFELVDVSEVLRGLKSGGQLELPFQYLPLVVVALHLGPGRIVGDRLHLVPLAVNRAGAAAIAVDHWSDVDVETEYILVQERIG